MKTSKALRLTKEHLWDGLDYDAKKRQYICHAASDAGVDSIVCPIIMELLDEKTTLEEWFTTYPRKAPKDFYSLPHLQWRRKMQITRHAWLDHLIKHYEELGD